MIKSILAKKKGQDKESSLHQKEIVVTEQATKEKRAKYTGSGSVKVSKSQSLKVN